MPGLLAYVRTRAFPLYSRALLLRIVASSVRCRLCCYRSFIPWHRPRPLCSWLIMAPDSFAPAFAFACSRLSDSEPLRASPCRSGRGCSLSLVVVPPPCRKPCSILLRVLFPFRVHFYKNIYYFGYFIPKNVQNARYFALFSKNIWKFQKNVLPLQRQTKNKRQTQ